MKKLLLGISLLVIAAAPTAMAVLTPLGTTVDNLNDNSKWKSATTQGTISLINNATLNNDPLGGSNTRLTELSGWPAPAGTLPGLFTYQADAGLRFSKVKFSVLLYSGASTPQTVGVADSTGKRINSIALPYAAGSIYIPSVASYSGITPQYSSQLAVPAAGGLYGWYTVTLDLPETATSLIDSHVETFNQISIGDWGGAWAARIGTVELTTVVVPEPTTFAMLAVGLTLFAVVRRRRSVQILK